MRQPIWIINSSILILIILMEAIVFIFHAPVPRKASLAPSAMAQTTAIIVQSVDIEQIYKNDIFNTYIYEAEAGEGLIQNKVPEIPSAPQVVPVNIPEIEQPTFVTPLDVTLKGVMFLADDQLNSVAVVQSNSVKTEANYRIGEFIEDAQVLKMFADKVLVIRSNGQQEMLYLREEDAAQDLQLEDRSTFQHDIVFLIQEGVYSVNVANFVQKINNLGQFIDMLGLVAVYNKGQASGCRVGEVGNKSLGEALGLEEGDIIEKIDDELITNLTSRVTAYNKVIKKSVGDVVSVSIRRGNQQAVFVYHLVDEARAKILADKYAASATQGSASVLVDTLSRSDYEIQKQRQEILSRKVAMAPTQRQIEEYELRNMTRISPTGANNYMNT